MNVGKGAVYLFIETIAAMFFGYGFWFLVSKFTTPEIIGTSGAVVSLATIFITIATLGVPTGVQRFLGKSFSEQKLENSKVLVKASLLLISIGIIACSILILILRDWIHDAFAIDFSLVIVAILLIASSSVTTLFRSIIISSLKTRMLPVIAIVSGSTKMGLGIVLVLIGIGALGVTIGFTFFSILSSILLAINLVVIFKSKSIKSESGLRNSCRNILIASAANWIPAMISTIGSQLGTIVVFGTRGANPAGVYFIAFSIFAALLAITSVLISIAYPALSAMGDGRKRFAWRITKMSLIIALPLSSSFIFYSKEIMQLFGHGYTDGSFVLEILLLSTLPATVGSGINSLIYSRGNYRQVLVIGMASSIPRTVLYFILVPIFGSTGAAISFTTGSVIGFVLSIIAAKVIGFQISWKELGVILTIPTLLGFILNYFGINYIVGILVTIFLSCILFLILRVITRSDMNDSLGILPPKIANPTLKLLNAIAKKLNSSY